MKRVAVLVVCGVILLVMPQVAAQPSCTIRGTPQRDFINGTPQTDRICARGGGDYATGNDSPDAVRGGPGPDTLVGGDGHDLLLGRAGDDKLFAIDGSGGDVVRGGRGVDDCYGEKSDTFKGCESVVTNMSPEYPLAAVIGLSDALQHSIRAANQKLCLLDGILCVENRRR